MCTYIEKLDRIAHLRYIFEAVVGTSELRIKYLLDLVTNDQDLQISDVISLTRLCLPSLPLPVFSSVDVNVTVDRSQPCRLYMNNFDIITKYQ